MRLYLVSIETFQTVSLGDSVNRGNSPLRPMKATKIAGRLKLSGRDEHPSVSQDGRWSQPPPSLSPGPGQVSKVKPGKDAPEVRLTCRSHWMYARCICAKDSMPRAIGSPAGPLDFQKVFACSAKVFIICS